LSNFLEGPLHISESRLFCGGLYNLKKKSESGGSGASALEKFYNFW